jgi:hypothetical protein
VKDTSLQLSISRKHQVDVLITLLQKKNVKNMHQLIHQNHFMIVTTIAVTIHLAVLPLHRITPGIDTVALVVIVIMITVTHVFVKILK